MRRTGHNGKKGFTLTEVVIASSILVIGVAMATSAIVYAIRASRQGATQDELDVDVQNSMERLKIELRLSATDKMFYHPADSNAFTAISFPLAEDTDGDGMVEIWTNNKIIWDKQVIYHIKNTTPNEMRRTEFTNRLSSLTSAQRAQQLADVVASGDGSSTYEGASSRTTTLFDNMLIWSIVPSRGTYDGYSPTTTRQENVNLGSAVLSNATHSFTFSIIGKHGNSSGYKMGIDYLTISACGAKQEGENLSGTVGSGPATSGVYMAGGSWSGNYQLYFPATASGQNFTVTINNDEWKETNFRMTGEQHDGTTVDFDTALSPWNFVVKLADKGTNWQASLQTGDASGANEDVERLRGCAVRVLVRGSEMMYGSAISASGGRIRACFKAGAGNLDIQDAFIVEAAVTDTITNDALATATPGRFLFSGAQNTLVSAGTNKWSDWLAYPIDRDKSYLVSYLVNNTGNGNVYKWTETTYPSVNGCFVIPMTNAPAEVDCTDPVWSTKGHYATNLVYSLEMLEATYTTNGVYTSGVIDTTVAAPVYGNVTWSAYVPGVAGCTLGLRARSATNSAMSDAPAWSTIALDYASPLVIGTGNKRYVQIQAVMTPDSTGVFTPKLMDFTVPWSGGTKEVTIGGAFTKGPDYGQFSVAVDGQPVIRGLKVDLEIYKDSPVYGGGNRRMTSKLVTDIEPRNTNRGNN